MSPTSEISGRSTAVALHHLRHVHVHVGAADGHRRLVVALRPAVVEHLDPVLEPELGGQCSVFVVEVGMELLQVVRGQEQRVVA